MDVAAIQRELQERIPGARFRIRFTPAIDAPIVVDVYRRRSGFLGKLGLFEKIGTGLDQDYYADAFRKALESANPSTRLSSNKNPALPE